MMSLSEFYDEYNEDSRLVSTRPGQLEFAMTIKVIDEKNAANASILELGAGSGRYSVYYARNGHEVTAVEISPVQSAQIQQKKADLNLGNLKVYQRDARDLAFLKEPFDAILCLGPYYHLRKKADRLAMLSGCKRLLAENGVLFVAYINKYFGIPICQSIGVSFDQEELSDILDGTYRNVHGSDPFLDIAYMCDRETVEKELQEAGFEIVDHAGVDGLYAMARQRFDDLPEEKWNRILAYHESVMRHPSVIGSSSHGLVVCR